MRWRERGRGRGRASVGGDEEVMSREEKGAELEREVEREREGWER